LEARPARRCHHADQGKLNLYNETVPDAWRDYFEPGKPAQLQKRLRTDSRARPSPMRVCGCSGAERSSSARTRSLSWHGSGHAGVTRIMLLLKVDALGEPLARLDGHAKLLVNSLACTVEDNVWAPAAKAMAFRGVLPRELPLSETSHAG